MLAAHKLAPSKSSKGTVRVCGSYEAGESEHPRLVSVETIEVLRRPDGQIDLNLS